MSGDRWAACPRCTARNDLSYRGNEFREDFEIGLIEDETPPRIIVKYNGECQQCGLLVRFEEYHEVPDWYLGARVEPPPPVEREWPWSQIRAGWEVLTPKGEWLEVALAYRDEDGRQVVTFTSNARTRQDPAATVTARSRETDVPWDTITTAFPGAEILEDGS
jgi:hypothetical protein